MKYRQAIARFFIGSVLIYAGFMKAVGPAAEFAAILQAYKLFPLALITPLSIGLPYIEMWVGLFVLTGFCTRPALLASSTLFAAFLIVLLSAQIRGIDLVSCGCFGADALSPRHTLVMDSVLFILSLMTFLQTKQPPSFSFDRAFP